MKRWQVNLYHRVLCLLVGLLWVAVGVVMFVNYDLDGGAPVRTGKAWLVSWFMSALWGRTLGVLVVIAGLLATLFALFAKPKSSFPG
jgi:hypothetical protein